MSKDLMLSEALRHYLLAKSGEVASATLDTSVTVHSCGKFGGKLASLVAYYGPDYPLNQIDIFSLRQWRSTLLGEQVLYKDHPNRQPVVGEYSPYTIRDFVVLAKRFFNWCVDEKLIDENPSNRLNPPPIPDMPPKQVSLRDAQKMLGAAAAFASRDWLHYLLIEEGLTHKETYELKTSSIIGNHLFYKKRIRKSVNGVRQWMSEPIKLTLSSKTVHAAEHWRVSRQYLADYQSDLMFCQRDHFKEMSRGRIVRGLRDSAIMEILTVTGCRIKGLHGLRVHDLDLPNQRILVREKGLGGSGAARICFVDDRCVETLSLWIDHRPNQHSENIWQNENGKQLNIRSLQKIIEGIKQVTGVTINGNAHSFRHLFAMEQLRNGTEPTRLQHIMGHKSYKSTLEYVRWQVDDLQEAHKRGNWRLKIDDSLR